MRWKRGVFTDNSPRLARRWRCAACSERHVVAQSPPEARQTMPNIIDQFRDELADLCRRTGARRLDAFGSAVRADFDPATSDLDFLVEFDAVPPAEYAELFFELKEGLEALFARPVDLVTVSSLSNPHFRKRIEAERRPVYAR
jgi:uncharacterized protein